MATGQFTANQQLQLQKIAAQLFPNQDPTEPDVQKILDYLVECTQLDQIGDKFFRIFHKIPREAIQSAISQGKTVSEVIIRCAELQSRELGDRSFHETARGVNRIDKAAGQRHRGKSAHAG